ncbi:MAG: hypothetical protein KAJ88_01075 [Candidatus Aenigmarchaeota archaeon]|nr:hypothetical protein [Candidatus Aenigmarchaeota archaeon]
MVSEKNNRMRGVGLFFAGIGALLGIASNGISENYSMKILIIGILSLAIGVSLVFKYRR